MTTKAKAINERSHVGEIRPVGAGQSDSSNLAIITSGKNNFGSGNQKQSSVKTDVRGEVVDQKDYLVQTEETTADQTMLMMLRRLLKGGIYSHLFEFLVCLLIYEIVYAVA